MVNSNFYGLVCIVFKDAVYIRPTTVQTARAANIVCAAFQYRTELDHENIKPVYYKKKSFFFGFAFLIIFFYIVISTKINSTLLKST